MLYLKIFRTGGSTPPHLHHFLKKASKMFKKTYLYILFSFCLFLFISNFVLSAGTPNKITIMKKIKGEYISWDPSPEEDVFRYNIFYSINGGEFNIYNPGTITVPGCVEVIQKGTFKRVYVCLSDEAEGVSETREVILTVMSPPVITENPSSQTVNIRETAILIATATGTLPLIYQWQKDTVNLTNGDRINGVDTPTLQIFSVEDGDKGSYRCIVTNSIGSSTSDAAVLTVQSQDSSLKAYWKLDDGSGTTVIDGSGNGNTGSLVNGPTWINGHINGALSFDGIDDYVNVGTSDFGVTSEMTISFWVYAAGSGTGYQTIISRNRYFYSFGVELSKTSGKLRSSFRTSSGVNYLISNSILPLDTWHHITVTYRTGERIIYLDGVPIGSTNTLSEELSVYPIYTTTIGSNGAGGQFFNGRLDDIRIYNRALNSLEVFSLFNKLSMNIESSTVTQVKIPSVSDFYAKLSVGRTLTVYPSDSFISSGPVGGLFNPNSKIYILSNIGFYDLKWTVSNTVTWLDLFVSGGTLAPRSSVLVNVSINSNANTLSSGVTIDTLTFTNTTFKIPSIYNTNEYYINNINGNVKVGTVNPDKTPVRGSSFLTNKLESGIYKFCVSSIDFAGNESEKSNIVTIIIPNYEK
jgi:hypothetical protein